MAHKVGDWYKCTRKTKSSQFKDGDIIQLDRKINNTIYKYTRWECSIIRRNGKFSPKYTHHGPPGE